MGTIAQKLEYLNTTKSKLKDSINALGGEIDNTTTFRDYATELDTIYSNLPKVEGEGTNLSLSPTLKGRLDMKYKGDTTQNTLTGKNLLAPTEDFEETLAGIKYTGSNGIYTIKGTATAGSQTTARQINNYTIQNGDYLHIMNNSSSSNVGIILTFTDDSTRLPSLSSTNRIFDLSSSAGKTLSTIQFNVTNVGSYDITLSPMIIHNVSTDTSYEPYCGGIPSPNPNYPQDIQVVTGTQTLTISNSDNTESQTYTLHLGDLELAKIGSYQDYIYYDNGKWYKLPKINNMVFNGTETGWSSASYGTNSYQIAINDLIPSTTENQNTLFCMSNLFRGVTFANRTLSGDNIAYPDSTGSTYGRLYIRNTSITSLDNFKTLLGTTNLKFYYVTTNNEPVEITNTTLLSDLEYIRTHAMSYSGTTNISSSGDLPIVISARALKGE